MQNEFQTHFSQDIARYSVLQIKRKATNKIVGFIFALSFLLWIVVGAYGVYVPTQRTNNAAFDFSQLNITRILNTCGFILLSAAFTLIAFILLRWVPEVTKITLAVFWIPVPCSILVAYYVMISLYSQKFAFYVVLQVIASILSCILVIILLSTEWFHMPEKVLKEACKMIASVPSTLVFTLYSGLLTVFLTVVLVLVTVKLFSTPLTYIKVISIFVNFIFGSWTIVTLTTLNCMTLNGTFAEYYWVANKNRVSFGTILHLFVINLRYHIGTAAMHYLGGIIALSYLLKQVQSLISKGNSKSVKLFFLYNVFDPILVRILLLGGAATCSIKGKNFYESMTHTMTLYMNNPRRVLVVFKVLEIVLAFMTGLVILFTSFSTVVYLVSGSSHSSAHRLFDLNSWEMKFWFLVLMGGIMIVAALLQCICAASCSIMLCLQEEVVQLGDSLPRGSYAMSRDLHSALKHDGPPPCCRNLCSC